MAELTKTLIPVGSGNETYDVNFDDIKDGSFLVDPSLGLVINGIEIKEGKVTRIWVKDAKLASGHAYGYDAGEGTDYYMLVSEW